MILKGLNQGGPDETEGAFGKAERSSRSAGAGLSAVVDFGTDPCRISLRAAQFDGGIPDGAIIDGKATEPVGLCEGENAMSCDVDRNRSYA